MQDRIQHVQKQVDEVKEIMRVNVDAVLSRDEKLDELTEKADTLSSQARSFTSASRRHRLVVPEKQAMKLGLFNYFARKSIWSVSQSFYTFCIKPSSHNFGVSQKHHKLKIAHKLKKHPLI